MKKPIFTGSCVAIVTPMNSDGSVNYDEYGKLIDFQIENGTDAVLACGTTGESAVLDHKEHCSVIEYTLKKVNGRVPVIAGTGSNDTAYAIELTKEAKNMGADAVLSVTPYYNKTSQAGLVAHFSAIANAVDIPMIVYNVPSRTGCNIKPETYVELSKVPNIVATKEAGDKIGEAAKTLALCGDNLGVYTGCDDMTVPVMSLGGIGVISVFANVMPKEMHEITQLCLNGDYKKAAEMHLHYLELMNALFCDVNPIPVKAAMNMMGFNCGECRLPLVPLSDKSYSYLKSVMDKYGLIK
ncbi:MAG: 4-hydroxy-tetrahydrodipicolinate synthase [Acutalibacteraceae bacterium]|nr:4-hydroxy-tetrahydrodipicolinate synthase [Acutalibacteraceae bacterium]